MEQGNNVEFVKKYLNLIVIVCLIGMVLYQAVTGRGYKSELERDKKQLAINLDAARKAEREATDRANALQKQLSSVANGINSAYDTASDSGKLINRIKDLAGQIPAGCVCRD